MSIPKGWEEVRLGDICSDVIGGGTPSTKNSKFWQGDIPWISSSDLIDESIYHIDTTRFITQEAIDKSATKLIPKNSVIVVTRVGLGKLAINDKELCTSQDFQSLIFKNQNYLFMAYAIKHNIYDTIKIMQGTSIKGITKEQLKSMKIKLPPLKEQEKIAEILSSCDEHIKNLKNLKSELEKEKLHLMNELLSGKTRFSSFTTPWQEVKLGDLIKEISDKTTINNEYDILSVTKEGIFLQTEHFNHQVASKNNIGYKILRKGNLVFSTMNLWMGSLDILKNYEVGIVSPAYKVFEVDYSKCDLFFMDNFLKTKKMIDLYNLNSQTGASIVRKNLDLKGLLSENIKIPRLEEQKKIGEVLSACDERLECLNELITAQTTLKSHLLTELLTGNIRVNI